MSSKWMDKFATRPAWTPEECQDKINKAISAGITGVDLWNKVWHWYFEQEPTQQQWAESCVAELERQWDRMFPPTTKELNLLGDYQ